MSDGRESGCDDEGRGDSLLAIFATCYIRYKYRHWPIRYATDSLLAIYATMNIWLVADQSLTDTLHIYILTFTLQFFPSMERNLSKGAKHRLGWTVRRDTQDLFQHCTVHYNITVYTVQNIITTNLSWQVMSSVSHAY